MKFARLGLLSVAALLVAAPRVASAQTATQTVTLTVNTISTISVNVASFTITVNVLNTDVVDNTSATYSVSDNSGTSMKITGKVDVVTAGLTFKVLLQTPGAGTATQKTLSTSDQDLVSGFANVGVTGRTITYTVNAAATVAPASYAKVVTFTLIAV
jgi:hypothetical protein